MLNDLSAEHRIGKTRRNTWLPRPGTKLLLKQAKWDSLISSAVRAIAPNIWFNARSVHREERNYWQQKFPFPFRTVVTAISSKTKEHLPTLMHKITLVC